MAANPGIPLVAQGHSFGAVVTLSRLVDDPGSYRAGVVSGAPLVPIAGMLDADSSFDLDPAWLSADPFYLDTMENDPLAFVDADGAPLTRELDRAWDRFGDAVQEVFTAKVELAVRDGRGGAEGVLKMVDRQGGVFPVMAQDNRGPVATGDVDPARGADR